MVKENKSLCLILQLCSEISDTLYVGHLLAPEICKHFALKRNRELSTHCLKSKVFMNSENQSLCLLEGEDRSGDRETKLLYTLGVLNLNPCINAY